MLVHETCLPLDVVGRQPGRPQMKRLCSQSKCNKLEHSTIICSICKNDRGHNKRTFLASKNATTTIEAAIEATIEASIEATDDTC
jgi:hypothetical protein